MELLFESRPNVSAMSGHLVFFQHRPRIHPDLVLRPDCYADELGVNHYGTVLRDQGKLRMWYLAMGREMGDHTLGGAAAVAYAESADGLRWEKPPLGLVDYGPGPNNLTDLGLHSATIFIDPDSPPERRYRAVGCGRPLYHLGHPGVTANGYYTAWSADGLRWTLESPTPRWDWIDVVTSVYHPGRRTGIVALKVTPTVMRIARRSIHTATFRDGSWSDHVAALYPDDFDDICAAQRGFHSCDYYGMGMMPAGQQGLVGFLWRYWHQLPYSQGWGNGPQALYGRSDISLVYQPEPGAHWFHLPGRPLFISRDDVPFGNGWIYSGSTPVEVDGEQRLYFTARPHPHGYGRSVDWGPDGKRHRGSYAGGGITFASWPKWRLFGFEALPEATLSIRLGKIDRPSRVRLNYETIEDGGYIRAELEGDGFAARQPAEGELLTGDSTGATLSWQGDTIIPPTSAARLNLQLSHARVYAYEVVPVAD